MGFRCLWGELAIERVSGDSFQRVIYFFRVGVGLAILALDEGVEPRGLAGVRVNLVLRAAVPRKNDGVTFGMN